MDSAVFISSSNLWAYKCNETEFWLPKLEPINLAGLDWPHKHTRGDQFSALVSAENLDSICELKIKFSQNY